MDSYLFPIKMIKRFFSGLLGGHFGSKQKRQESFDDEKEISRSAIFQRRVKRTSILHRLVLASMGVFALALTIQTFIIHHEISDSSLMMLIGYLSIALTIAMFAVNVIDVCVYSMGSPPPNYHFIVSSMLFVILFSFAVSTSIMVPAMVYRHANEQFMELFFKHKIHIQGLLIGMVGTVVMLCFVGVVSLLMYWCEGRYNYVKMTGAN